MKHLFLLLLTTSCVTSQDSQDKKDYKANLIDIQMPYTLGYYELKGDVIGLEKALGNSMDSTQLYKFDTENYTFQDGFLKEYHKENVEGNTYKVKKSYLILKKGNLLSMKTGSMARAILRNPYPTIKKVESLK